MYWDIVSATYLGEFRIELKFKDGKEGVIDLADHLSGPIFEPLKDRGAFASFTVHPELGILTWPNGADLAPEFVYDLATGGTGANTPLQK